MSTSSSARRRTFGRIEGFGGVLRVVMRSADHVDALRECSFDVGANFDSQCLATPCQGPQFSYAERFDKLAPKARTTVGGASSLHAQAHRVPASIFDIADAALDRSGPNAATSGVALVGNGKRVAFAAPVRVPKCDGVSVMAADNDFAAAVSAKAMRGYDAAQNEGLAPGAQFDPTTVMNKTWAPERPQAGGGNTGHEP